MIFQKLLVKLEINGNQNINNKSTMKIILISVFITLISIFLVNIIWQFLLLIWNCLHWTRGEEMIIDGYQRENMFKALNGNLNSIQIPTPVDTNKSATKQIVYKIDGNFNGNIKGDNVTVIIMGDGNINGDIESENGEVVLIKGDINGDVKANKIICPDKPSNEKKIAPCTIPIDLKCPSCNQIYTQELNTSVEKINNNKYKVEIAAPYNKTKKEEPEISNYMCVRPINMKCPNCHQFINKNLRIDASVVNNKLFHTMITPLDNNY